MGSREQRVYRRKMRGVGVAFASMLMLGALGASVALASSAGAEYGPTAQYQVGLSDNR
jgi:hypothetical protein